MVLTWDADSRGVLATRNLEFPDAFFLQGKEVECVFPRPTGTGPLELWIFGEHVATVEP